MKNSHFKPYIIVMIIIASLFIANNYIITESHAVDINFPIKTGGVIDPDHLLTTSEATSLNKKIQSFENEKGAQIAVLIIATTQPLSIEEYSNSIFNQWRIGRLGIDDGVLLVVAKEDRAVRIEVGYGLEGQITDLFSKQVIDDYILPNFKVEEYNKGISLAIDALISKINHEPLPAVKNVQFYIAKQTQPIGFIDIIAGIILAGSLWLWGACFYYAVKSAPIKVSIFVLLLVFVTWYFGGFDMSSWNGLSLGEDYLKTELPRWVQILLLQIFPSWVAIIMILTGFIVVCFGFILVLGGFVITLTKLVKSDKLRLAIFGGLFFGITIFIIAYSLVNLMVSLIISFSAMLLVGRGFYTGAIKPGSSGSASYRNGGGGSSSSSSSSSRSSSSSSSSGGGGRSGGGGASGRW